MSKDVGIAPRAVVVRKAQSDRYDIVKSARRFAAAVGHPIDVVDDGRILAGLRRLNVAVAAYRR